MKVHLFREQLQVMPQFTLNTNEESSTAFSIKSLFTETDTAKSYPSRTEKNTKLQQESRDFPRHKAGVRYKQFFIIMLTSRRYE